MFSKIGVSRWLIVVAVLAVAEFAVVTAIEVAFTAPAQAQFFGDQQYQYRRAQPRSGGFFQNFFSPFNSRPNERRIPAATTRIPAATHATAKRKLARAGAAQNGIER